MAAHARAARIPEEEWDRHRGTIELLYIHANRNLARVIQELGDTHHFYATDKQYKRQLASWGMRKNISTKEMRALVDGPVENPTVRGNAVPQAKLARFVRRQKQKASKLGQEQSQKIPLGVVTSSGDELCPLSPSLAAPLSPPTPVLMLSPSISNKRPWMPHPLPHPDIFPVLPELNHCHAITLLHSMVHLGVSFLVPLDEIDSSSSAAFRTLLSKILESLYGVAIKLSYWEWQRLILAFIFLEKMDAKLRAQRPLLPLTSPVWDKSEGPVLLQLIMKFTDMYMGEAQPTRRYSGIDYFCTGYDPGNENAFVTTWGTAMDSVLDPSFFSVSKDYFQRTLKRVEDVISRWTP